MYRVKYMTLNNFRAILEELSGNSVAGGDASAPPGEQPPRGTWRSSDQVQYAFDAMASDVTSATFDRVAKLYGENPSPPRDAIEPNAQSSKRKTVAEELSLHSGLSPAELHRLRREFASRNHPDRVPAWQRDEATRRMTIANVLIDRALKRRAAREN